MAAAEAAVGEAEELLRAASGGGDHAEIARLAAALAEAQVAVEAAESEWLDLAAEAESAGLEL